MTLILKQIYALFKMLNSETGSNQIAAGIACGFILGMSPALSLQTLLVFLIIFVFRVQAGAAFLALFFFKFIAFIFDPLFDKAGAAVLHAHGLQGLFTAMYNMPIIPLTRFNNTIVMGSGLVAIVLAPFVYLGARVLINKYRVHIADRVRQSKYWKALKATAVMKWYFKYENLYGHK